MKEKNNAIKININDESLIYNSFNSNELSYEFVTYILNKISEISYNDDIYVEINTKINIDIDKLEKCFISYLEHEIKELTKELQINHIKKIRLISIGIFFLALSFLLTSAFSNVLVEMLSIIGSFAIWELTDIFLLDDHQLKLERFKIEKYKTTKFILKQK